MRELWTTRDHIARRRDIAPGRILPDSAIINAATADPKTVEELTALPVFGGSKQRRSAQVWLDALAAPATTDDLPEISEPQNGPPPASRWAGASPRRPRGWRRPAPALTELSRAVSVPTENLVTPEVVRRLCWDWQRRRRERRGRSRGFCAMRGARQWQRELVVPVLAAALAAVPLAP